MNQTPIRPQRGEENTILLVFCSQKVRVLTLDVSGLVPFSKDAKEPFFSSTWDEFDQMRNQVPKQLDALLKKNGGCARIQNHS